MVAKKLSPKQSSPKSAGRQAVRKAVIKAETKVARQKTATKKVPPKHSTAKHSVVKKSTPKQSTAKQSTTKQSTAQKSIVSKKTRTKKVHTRVAKKTTVGSAPVYKKLNLAATLSQALKLYQQARYQDAYYTCELIIGAKPNQAEALQLMASIATRNKNFSLALKLYQRVLVIEPNNFSAHNNCGVLWRLLKDPAAALAHCESALRLQANYPEALNNMGVALIDLARPQEAATYFKKALTLKPNYADAKANLERVTKAFQLQWARTNASAIVFAVCRLQLQCAGCSVQWVVRR